MRRLLSVPAVAFLLLGIQSCGDDGSASGFAAAYCDLLKPCCEKANLRTDGKQCQLLFGAFGGEASYNKEAGETCLAETRAAAGQATFCQDPDEGGSGACDRVFSQRRGNK